MIVDTDNLKALTTSQKIQLVEAIWDELAESQEPLPFPDWFEHEIHKRREEMRDPHCGVSHAEVWRRVERRDG